MSDFNSSDNFYSIVPAPAGRWKGISRLYTPQDVLKLRPQDFNPLELKRAIDSGNAFWHMLKSGVPIKSYGMDSPAQAVQVQFAGTAALTTCSSCDSLDASSCSYSGVIVGPALICAIRLSTCSCIAARIVS